MSALDVSEMSAEARSVLVADRRGLAGDVRTARQPAKEAGPRSRHEALPPRRLPAPTTRMTIRVLLADDQALGFKALMDAADELIEVVGEASDRDEAVKLTRDVRTDVVLMDIRMPGVDGLEASVDGLEATGVLQNACPADHVNAERLRIC
jgi:CheY-like chemotaxis protein